MILYTIVPEQLIYPIDDRVYAKQKIVNCNGIDMVVEACGDSGYSIIRILSSDPQHYLQYQPGQRVWIH
ncbi:YlzJ-like family protein [Ectobacillus panaciterrae]|uniref:YlzJ-like family protein n=1 Tax=Ectobacillus panaciterrae TaxID=363872 RepID=UPI0004298747|nr:YlzJ-like family protein [Ectobacillus panaciterrae]